MEQAFGRYLTVLRHDSVQDHVLGDKPAWVFSPDGREILWSNSAGLAFLDIKSLAALGRYSLGGSSPVARRLAQLASSEDAGHGGLERFRFFVGTRAKMAACLCQPIALPGGGFGVLAVAVDAPASRGARPGADLVRVFEAAGIQAAMIAPSGAISAATSAFEAAGDEPSADNGVIAFAAADGAGRLIVHHAQAAEPATADAPAEATQSLQADEAGETSEPILAAGDEDAERSAAPHAPFLSEATATPADEAGQETEPREVSANPAPPASADAPASGDTGAPSGPALSAETAVDDDDDANLSDAAGTPGEPEADGSNALLDTSDTGAPSEPALSAVTPVDEDAADPSGAVDEPAEAVDDGSDAPQERVADAKPAFKLDPGIAGAFAAAGVALATRSGGKAENSSETAESAAAVEPAPAAQGETAAVSGAESAADANQADRESEDTGATIEADAGETVAGETVADEIPSPTFATHADTAGDLAMEQGAGLETDEPEGEADAPMDMLTAPGMDVSGIWDDKDDAAATDDDADLRADETDGSGTAEAGAGEPGEKDTAQAGDASFSAPTLAAGLVAATAAAGMASAEANATRKDDETAQQPVEPLAEDASDAAAQVSEETGKTDSPLGDWWELPEAEAPEAATSDAEQIAETDDEPSDEIEPDATDETEIPQAASETDADEIEPATTVEPEIPQAASETDADEIGPDATDELEIPQATSETDADEIGPDATDETEIPQAADADPERPTAPDRGNLADNNTISSAISRLSVPFMEIGADEDEDEISDAEAPREPETEPVTAQVEAAGGEAGPDAATPSESAPLPTAPAFSFAPRRSPHRFVWEMGADRRFSKVTRDLGEAIGPGAAAIVGKTWQDVSNTLDLNNPAIASRIEAGQTWTGMRVDWPVEASDRMVPVELTALPIYDQNRKFAGYRGFGVCRTDQAKPDPAARGQRLVKSQVAREFPQKPAIATAFGEADDDDSDHAGPAGQTDGARDAAVFVMPLLAAGQTLAGAPDETVETTQDGQKPQAQSDTAAEPATAAQEPAGSDESLLTTPDDAQAQSETAAEPATAEQEPAAPEEGPLTTPDDAQAQGETVTEPATAAQEPAGSYESLPTTPGDAQAQAETAAEPTTAAEEPAAPDEGPQTTPDDAQAQVETAAEPVPAAPEPVAESPVKTHGLIDSAETKSPKKGLIAGIAGVAWTALGLSSSRQAKPDKAETAESTEAVEAPEAPADIAAQAVSDHPANDGASKTPDVADSAPQDLAAAEARSPDGQDQDLPVLDGESGQTEAGAPRVALDTKNLLGLFVEPAAPVGDRSFFGALNRKPPFVNRSETPVTGGAQDAEGASVSASQPVAAGTPVSAETPVSTEKPVSTGTPVETEASATNQAPDGAGPKSADIKPGSSAGADDGIAKDARTSAAKSNIIRMVPSNGGDYDEQLKHLSRPEREAFKQIADVLSARGEGEAAGTRKPAAGRSAAPGGPNGPKIEIVEPNSPVIALPSAFAIGRRDVPEGILLDRLPTGVLLCRGADVLFANRAALDLLDYASCADLRHAGGLDAIFTEPASQPQADRAEETDRPITVQTRSGAVKTLFARLYSVPWANDRAMMIVFDAAQRQAPGAPRQVDDDRVEELESILDTATDGVLVMEADGTILAANKSAEALFGANSAEMIGAGLVDYLAPESHRSALDYIDGLARNGVESVLNDGREVIGLESSGGLIPLFMTMGRINKSSRKVKFCAVLRDITQWKKAEEDLTSARRQAETASSHKSDFLAKISHEIRTPLNAIIGFSEVMLGERLGPIGTERYKEYLHDIRSSGDYIMSLINDLLDLSKIEAGKMDLTFEAVAINDILHNCVALLQPEANRERVIIRTSLSTSVPNVVADARSVQQIILNLLSNAIKFNKRGGQVIVSSVYTDDGDVCVRVRDTGIGMSEDDLRLALEPFRQVQTTRSNAGGTGLGLPLTKALVEANRAGFDIDSKPNEGTMVEITFPSQRVLAG